MIRKGPEGNTLVLLWLLMLAEAGKCNRGGYLMVSDSLPYTAETLSMVTDIALPTVQLGLTIFAGLEMIDQQDGIIFIANWSKYQSEDKLEKPGKTTGSANSGTGKSSVTIFLPFQSLPTCHVTVTLTGHVTSRQRTEQKKR